MSNQHALTVNRVRPLPQNQRDCEHPNHGPVRSLHTGPGMYKHTCPGCGKETYYTIPNLSEFD